MYFTLHVVLIVICVPVFIQGLKCYECTSQGSTDPRCEAGIDNSVINCNMKYCTIKRREFLDPKGRVDSFHRGCEERPLYTNKAVMERYYITYYRACQLDLCNEGSGVNTTGGNSGGGWLDNGGLGTGSADGGPVIVPGLGGAMSLRQNVVVLAFLGILLVFVNHWNH